MDRRSVLINGVDVRLKELIQQTCEQLNVEIIDMKSCQTMCTCLWKIRHTQVKDAPSAEAFITQMIETTLANVDSISIETFWVL